MLAIQQYLPHRDQSLLLQPAPRPLPQHLIMVRDPELLAERDRLERRRTPRVNHPLHVHLFHCPLRLLRRYALLGHAVIRRPRQLRAADPDRHERRIAPPAPARAPDPPPLPIKEPPPADDPSSSSFLTSSRP